MQIKAIKMKIAYNINQARICMSKFKVNSFIPQKLMKIKKRNN